MNSRTQKIVLTALMAALVCIATMVIRIPSPFRGYLNLGDCAVLAAGWLLPPGYGFLAAGIGSALADVFSGYLAYAPATFAVKGLVAVTAYYGFRLLGRVMSNLPSRIISGAAAETVMVLGYYLFEGMLYGFAPSLVNIPANCVQGAAGLVAGVLLIKMLEKSGLYKGKDAVKGTGK